MNFNSETTDSKKTISFVTLSNYDALDDIIAFYRPEWATKEPIVTFGDTINITWHRDPVMRPILP